jgi:hypothetical protein
LFDESTGAAGPTVTQFRAGYYEMRDPVNTTSIEEGGFYPMDMVIIGPAPDRSGRTL